MNEQKSERPLHEDTVHSPILFRRTDDALRGADRDRRTSPRIPAPGRVRMGAPNGDPYAVVSASDISRNGLFIDADRPVRIGARFSTEIALEDGEIVYIPEAEVAYNRERPHASGFGARFIDPPDDVVKRLEDAIARAVRNEAKAIPSVPPISHFEIVESRDATTGPPRSVHRETEPSGETDTEVPKRARGRTLRMLDLDVTKFPEPVIPDAPLATESEISVDAAPTARPSRVRSFWDDIVHTSHAVRHRFFESARRFPNLWTGLSLGGAVLVLVAVGVAIWMGSRSDPIEIAPIQSISEPSVTATTHRALMGDRPEAALPDEPPSHRGAASDGAYLGSRAGEGNEGMRAATAKPLPPLVVVDERPLAAAASGAPAASLAPKGAPNTVPTTPPVPKGGPSTTPPVQKTAAQGGAVPQKGLAAASPAPKGAPSEPTQARLRIGRLSPGASVLKTHVLASPPRFVIDLAGQTGVPELPPASGSVRQIRYGVHPDRARLVIDAERSIESGRITKNGRELVVVLDYVRPVR